MILKEELNFDQYFSLFRETEKGNKFKALKI